MSCESVLWTAWYLLTTKRYCCPIGNTTYFHRGDLEYSSLERSQQPIGRKKTEETNWFPLKGLTKKVCMILGITSRACCGRQPHITQVRKLGFHTAQTVTSCNTSS